MHGGIAAAVREARVDHEAARVIGRYGAIDHRPLREQCVDERALDAGSRRMDARRCEPQRRGSAVQVRNSVDVRAAAHEQLRDLDDVGGRLLPEILDAICADVGEQRRSMAAGGSNVDELGAALQQAQKAREIAGDDRVDGVFERGDLRARLLQRGGVRLERGPPVELMERRDDRARVTVPRAPSAPGARKKWMFAKVWVSRQKRCQRVRVA